MTNTECGDRTALFEDIDHKEHAVRGQAHAQWNYSTAGLVESDTASEDIDEFLKAWEADAAHFKSQSGFISAQLHKGTGGSGTFINHAVFMQLSNFIIPYPTSKFFGRH